MRELSKLDPEEIQQGNQQETQIKRTDEGNYKMLMTGWELLPSQEDCSGLIDDHNYPKRRRLRLRARP